MVNTFLSNCHETGSFVDLSVVYRIATKIKEIECKKCNNYLSGLSKVTKNDDINIDYVNCSFCRTHTLLKIYNAYIIARKQIKDA